MDKTFGQIENCPLKIAFNHKDFSLHLSDEVVCQANAGKLLGQMKQLFHEFSGIDEAEKAYTFLEGVARKSDLETFKKSKLRYDLIVVYPGKISGEFRKTSGHYHCEVPGQGISYPEIYEVLQGKAVFLLQKANQDGSISESFAVKGKPGDKLVIPPEYGHATINVGDEPLIFADLVSTECHNIYGSIGSNHGMCYYVMDNGGQRFSLEENTMYQQKTKIVVTTISENPALGIWRDKPLYTQFVEKPDVYAYLNRPAEYKDKFIKF